jgi:hypothetical protein
LIVHNFSSSKVTRVKQGDVILHLLVQIWRQDQHFLKSIHVCVIVLSCTTNIKLNIACYVEKYFLIPQCSILIGFSVFLNVVSLWDLSFACNWYCNLTLKSKYVMCYQKGVVWNERKLHVLVVW